VARNQKPFKCLQNAASGNSSLLITDHALLGIGMGDIAIGIGIGEKPKMVYGLVDRLLQLYTLYAQDP